MKVGNTYKFDISHSSNGSHPLAFSTTSGGSHSGGSPYTTGVTSPSGFLQIIPEEAVTLYPYCTSHPGMGGTTQLNITTATTTETSYVEWVVDPSGSVDNTSITNTAMTNFGPRAIPGDAGIYYQSGVRYFSQNPTASYTCLGSNFYSNVYQKGTAISWINRTNANVSHITVEGAGHQGIGPNQPISSTDLPFLNNAADCETAALEITGTLRYTAAQPQISGGLGLFSTPLSFAAQCQVLHPLKSDRTGTLITKNAFMRHSGTIGFTNENTREMFQLERYRIVSGNYATQAEATGSSYTWNSATIMNAGGTHDDGMVTSNGYLISPKQIGNAGDTRNIDDGGSLQAPQGSPNYSSLTNGTRTYYRYFDKNTAGSSTQITITLYGSGSLVKKSLALTDGGGYFYLEAKIPGTTGWLDVGKTIGANAPLVDGSGAGTGYPAGNPPIDINTGGRTISCDFNGEGLSSGEKLILKISSDEDWNGYLSQVAIGY